jgi:hypothetical protein
MTVHEHIVSIVGRWISRADLAPPEERETLRELLAVIQKGDDHLSALLTIANLVMAVEPSVLQRTLAAVPLLRRALLSDGPSTCTYCGAPAAVESGLMPGTLLCDLPSCQEKDVDAALARR